MRCFALASAPALVALALPVLASASFAQVANDVTHWAEYDYVIVNHDLETSMRALTGILIAERLKRRRNLGLAEFVEQFRRSGTGLV